MKRSNVNVIIEDVVSSQEYYNMYSSRDFYRGTSFKMAGAWALILIILMMNILLILYLTMVVYCIV